MGEKNKMFDFIHKPTLACTTKGRGVTIFHHEEDRNIMNDFTLILNSLASS